IRTGEFILRTGSVPVRDLFSFSRAGDPWFAWEWLTDVIFARLHAWGGLEAVAALGMLVLCGSAAIVFAWLLSRDNGLWVSLAVTLAVVSASTVHYLARPHIFSILLFPLSLWILDSDLRRPGPWVWILVPLSALWANLHGGFVGWLASLALLPLVMVVERNWTKFIRYTKLTALCIASTLVNPYGWRLHQHIVEYLGSSWILDNVNEFQSPRIRSENMLVFAAILLIGAALAGRALARREWFAGTLVFLWGLASLRSARHIPLYAVIAAPVIASELSAWWRSAAAHSRRGGLAGVFWLSGQELGLSRRLGLWAVPLAVLALCIAAPQGGIRDFPSASFPVAAVTHNLDVLAPLGRMPRILTTDQWGDYLIYRLYPRQRVFFDGRSDFYGPGIGGDYKILQGAGRKWQEVLTRYGFERALLPADWPLGSILERDPNWQIVYRDKQAVLFARRPGVKKSAVSAECRSDG
ncbi:MAG TPA: hypothetical protein VKV17_00005, partial [Bryobacteraceae bacterium]|nr:hypothetical protein [Bryobacteraceae bacterium]